MTTWTADDLDRIGATEEVQVSSLRPDGSTRPGVTIWAVRVDDQVYVRSAYGSTNPWYRRAVAAGQGEFRVGAESWDIAFVPADPADRGLQESLDAAYHAKYDQHGPAIVGTVVGPHSWEVTLRLDPR